MTTPADSPLEPPSDPPAARPARADVRRFGPVVRSGVWFRDIPVALQIQLLDAARVLSVARGASLLRQGDAVDGLYCVVAGCLRVTTTSADGRQAMLAIAEPPQWFGEIALFDGAPVSHDVQASAPTTLLQVPRAQLLALLEATPAHWHALGLLLTHKLRAAFAAIEETTLLTPQQRLARRLLALSDGWGQSPERTRREVRVPQEQLGQMLGLTRQTVNRLLRQLSRDGSLRMGRGTIEIVDIETLRRLSGE